MSRNVQSKLQEHAVQRKHRVMRRRNIDQRVRRTHERLGRALLELILETPIDQVTVQEVLDRASVGRSTFYLHFRDTDDLLLSQLEGFLEIMSTTLGVGKEKSHRVVPVAELFAHIGNQNRLYRALAESAPSTTSSILHKATSRVGSNSGLRNPAGLQKFHRVN